jgi:hypothetical protein
LSRGVFVSCAVVRLVARPSSKDPQICVSHRRNPLAHTSQVDPSTLLSSSRTWPTHTHCSAHMGDERVIILRPTSFFVQLVTPLRPIRCTETWAPNIPIYQMYVGAKRTSVPTSLPDAPGSDAHILATYSGNLFWHSLSSNLSWHSLSSICSFARVAISLCRLVPKPNRPLRPLNGKD